MDQDYSLDVIAMATINVQRYKRSDTLQVNGQMRMIGHPLLLYLDQIGSVAGTDEDTN
jgi:hypothetical protein